MKRARWLEKACEPLSISAELREQTLLIDVPEGLRVKCDLNWTAEALLNVIKNCVEHTPRGGTVTVSARQNPLYALFMVADTGEGIAKKISASIRAVLQGQKRLAGQRRDRPCHGAHHFAGAGR